MLSQCRSRPLLVLTRVNDTQAGGAAGNNSTFEVITGTAAASPVQPTVPASAIALAVVGPITSATASITDAIISSARTLAGRKDTPGTLAWRADAHVPSGWLLADGSLHNIADYPALAESVGTTYGGDGTTTFGVPDGQGRVLAGPGGPIAASAGDTGGAATHTLTIDEMPLHTHLIAPHAHTAPAHNHSTPNHTHSIDHDHAVFTSVTNTHVHGMSHQHATATTATDTHTHTANSGNPVAFQGSTGTLGLADGAVWGAVYGAPLNVSSLTNANDSHDHDVVIPNYAGGTGSSTHGHDIDVPAFTGSSGNGGTSSTGMSASTNTGSTNMTSTDGTGVGNGHSILQPYAVAGGLVIRT